MNNSTKSKVALIFGGSGFIGDHLASELLAKGFEVHVADLLPPNNPKLSFQYCDVRRKIELNIARIPDLVFNLAAIHRTPGHDLNEYYVTNVGGTLNILAWCNQVGVTKIVFTSSIAVYGPSEDAKDEESIPEPIHAYGESKLLAEKLFFHWHSQDATRRSVVVCRPAVIFGPGENGNFTRLAKALRFKYFFYPGGPNTLKASGYVKDLVDSLLFMSGKTKNSIATYNFCFPQNYSIGQICEAFQKVAGYSSPISLPIATLGRILAFFPGPVNNLGQRLLKLVFPTIVTPSVLLDEGYVWKYDLLSAIDDWHRSVGNTGCFK